MKTRRQFLKSSSFAAAGAAIPIATDSLALPDQVSPLFDISLAEWSLHRSILQKNPDPANPPIDHLDFPKTAKSLGIDGIEYVNAMFFDKAQDSAYLQEMKSRADGEGVKSLIIMVDREGKIGDPDDTARKQTVENHLRWLEAAQFLGCHSIRVNAGSEGSYDEQLKLAADGLRQLSEKGDEFDLNVIVENHGGLSSNGQWLSSVMEAVDHPRCGTLPDFGNFTIDRKTNERYDPYQGVTDLMPYAKAVSAKAYDWNTGKGEFVTSDQREGRELDLDFKKLLKIVTDAGYTGYIGVEYEGAKHPEVEGIRLTREAMENARDTLS
ncbi:MAG: sugar phosphate isomerase/epimerase family protein [Verrucomicrobiota bacterium]